MYTDYNNLYSSYLSHSGKKGMKWGCGNHYTYWGINDNRI